MPDALKQNVLRDEQRLPRVPEPGVVVIFGASGDLTSRKLVPALYELASQRKLPMEFAIVGISRTEMDHEEFRKKLRETLEEHVSGGVSDDVWESFSGGIYYLPGDSKKPETYGELKEFLKNLDAERGTRGNRAFYLSASPSLFPTIVENLGEAVRAGPGERQGAQRGDPAPLRRGPDLPHRPLPRQGDGPEHPGPALRERDLRADLEPALRRPRPDHGRRGHRRGHQGRLLRGGRGPPRHRPEPRDAGPLPHRDGAAGRFRRGIRARGEGKGTESGAPDSARRGGQKRRARPVHLWLGVGGRGRGLSRGGRGGPRVRHRDLRGPAPLRGQLAVGGGAILLTGGQEDAEEGDGDRHPVPLLSPHALRPPGHREPGTERARRPRPARGGRLPEDRGEGARLGIRDQLREHGPALRHGVPGGGPRRLPAPPARPPARRPYALYPGGRGRGGVAHPRPRYAPLGGGEGHRVLPGRDLGAGGGGRATGAGRPGVEEAVNRVVGRQPSAVSGRPRPGIGGPASRHLPPTKRFSRKQDGR